MFAKSVIILCLWCPFIKQFCKKSGFSKIGGKHCFFFKCPRLTMLLTSTFLCLLKHYKNKLFVFCCSKRRKPPPKKNDNWNFWIGFFLVRKWPFRDGYLLFRWAVCLRAARRPWGCAKTASSWLLWQRFLPSLTCVDAMHLKDWRCEGSRCAVCVHASRRPSGWAKAARSRLLWAMLWRARALSVGANATHQGLSCAVCLCSIWWSDGLPHAGLQHSPSLDCAGAWCPQGSCLRFALLPWGERSDLC